LKGFVIEQGKFYLLQVQESTEEQVRWLEKVHCISGRLSVQVNAYQDPTTLKI
jgi:hypothetical protein